MTEPTRTATASPVPTPLTDRLRRALPNPSSLPIGPAALGVLLRDAIIMVEVRGVVTPYSVHIDDVRAVVVDTYHRLTPTERFRLHSGLMATLGYVPCWVQEITG